MCDIYRMQTILMAQKNILFIGWAGVICLICMAVRHGAVGPRA